MVNSVTRPNTGLSCCRYGLRTFFILLTGVCLWLGQQVQRAHDQERAVEAIQEAGGRVWYDYQTDGRGHFHLSKGPPGPDWLRGLTGEHLLTRVVDVEFRDVSLGDADLVRLVPHLERLAKLRSLGLNGTSVTDEGKPTYCNASR